MSKSILTKFSAGALASLTVLSFAACKTPNKTTAETSPAEAPAIKVIVSQPSVGYIEQSASFTGRVTPDDSVSVFGKSSGTVLRTYFEAGDTVEEGDLLFELDPEDYQIALEQSKVAYDMAMQNVDIAEHGSGEALTELQYQTNITQAQIAYEKARDELNGISGGDDFSFADLRDRRKKLKEAEEKYNDNESEETWQGYLDALKNYENVIDNHYDGKQERTIITAFEQAYDGYMLAVQSYEIYKSTQKGENAVKYDLTRQQAKLQYDSMLQTMDNLKVYAPISGVIEAKNVSANDVYAPSMAGYIVSNKDIMTITFAVSGNIVDNMAVGDMIIAESSGKQYKARITEIGEMVNNTSGLFTVEAKMDEMVKLRTGTSVKVTAVTNKNESGILIPYHAVYFDNDNAYVYLAKDSMAVRTPVTVGILSGDTAEITEGLTLSDSIITSWDPNLTDGIAVETSEEV